MNEQTYFGLTGRGKTENHEIARLIEDYQAGDWDSFEDLVYRFGIVEDEIRGIIERVLPTKPIKKPRIIYRKSKI